MSSLKSLFVEVCIPGSFSGACLVLSTITLVGAVESTEGVRAFAFIVWSGVVESIGRVLTFAEMVGVDFRSFRELSQIQAKEMAPKHFP